MRSSASTRASEMVSAATGGNTKPRNYGKRIERGKY